MRNAARYASFISFASVACVMATDALAQRVMDSLAPTASIEREVSVIRSEALETYLGQLVGDQEFKVVVFHQPMDNPEARQASASVLAAGTIFVSDRVLAEAKDETAFARTIAHAIAHVSLKHRGISDNSELKLMTRQAVSPMIFMTAGWAGYAQRDREQIQLRLVPFGYGKQNEYEADRAVAAILAGMHLDAVGFASAQAAVR